MQDSLMNPRLPAFRPMFDRPASIAPAPDLSPTGVAWLTAMAHGFISDAVQDSSKVEDPVPAPQRGNRE
jgi:hypothetical protein